MHLVAVTTQHLEFSEKSHRASADSRRNLCRRNKIPAFSVETKLLALLRNFQLLDLRAT